MLESLFESPTKEKILISCLVEKEVYARQISRKFNLNLLSVQTQLKKLERGGVLVSKLKGRTRLFYFNPRYAFLKEIKALLEKAMSFIPQKEMERYYMPRMRPRRSGRPL